MRQQHLLRDYRSMPEGNLGPFALNVADEIDGNVFFPTTKVTPKQLTDKANEFAAAYGKCDGGSKADTVHKNAVKKQLIALLDALAADLEETAQGSVEMLATTGFHLTDPSPIIPAPVGRVAISGVSNLASGKLLLNVDSQGNVWAVVLQTMTAPNVWVTAGVFTDWSNVVVPNTVPGQVYTFRACAMAASNQQSEWCESISHMST